MTSQTIYFVKCSFGPQIGQAWIEREADATGKAALMHDLINLQIENPLQILAVDVRDGISSDVTEDIAREIADWSSSKSEPLAQSLINFIHDNVGAAFARELKAA